MNLCIACIQFIRYMMQYDGLISVRYQGNIEIIFEFFSQYLFCYKQKLFWIGTTSFNTEWAYRLSH